MSVTSIKPASGRSGDYGSVTDSKVERKWVIQVTSKLGDDEVSIRNYGQNTLDPNGQPYLPKPLITAHPTLPQMICKSLRIDQDAESPLKWTAAATYTSRPFNDVDLSMQEAASPLQRAASISWHTVQYQEAGIKDLDSKGFCNSAGDPFDPPVEYQRSRWMINITKNVTIVPSNLPDYENAVNSDSFTVDGVSFSQYTLRLSGIGISELKREKIATGVEFLYRVISFRLEHNRDKWYPLKVLDQGYRYKSGSNRIPIREDNTNAASPPITSPALLDGSGTRLVNPTAATAKFVDFNVYPLKPFSGVIPVT